MKRNEAIEVVRKNYPHVSESDTQFETALRTLVPELVSEDERIRKEIIAYLDVQDAISDRQDRDFKNWIAWLEKQGEKQDYNPYKATVESIASMCDRYSTSDDLKDFYNNIKVKCKDAIEYDKKNNQRI